MKIGAIVVRCYEFEKMLAFWQEALHYLPREPPEDGWVVLRDPEGRGPNFSLDRVAEPLEPLGKTSRVHLDLYTTEQEGEVKRLLGIGATRYPQEYGPDDDFIVLEDPEGNRFCVVQLPDGGLDDSSKMFARWTENHAPNHSGMPMLWRGSALFTYRPGEPALHGELFRRPDPIHRSAWKGSAC